MPCIGGRDRWSEGTGVTTVMNAKAFCSAVVKSKRRSDVSRKRNEPVPRFPTQELLLLLQVAVAVSTASVPCVPRVYSRSALLLRETARLELPLPVSSAWSMISSFRDEGRTLLWIKACLRLKAFRPFSARSMSSLICGSISSVRSALYLRTVPSSTRRKT